MFGSSGLGVVLLYILFCLIITKGSLSQARRIPHDQKECYNTDAILTCPTFREANGGKLLWRYKDITTSRWVEIASIRHGISKVKSGNTPLDGRLNIYPNGSLEISSLKPSDETQYQCIVKQGSRKVHVIELSVSCGRVSKIERKVCVENDVVLECEAKHRTNPMKLKDIKWHKILKVSEDSAWLLLFPSNDSSAELDGGGLRLHENGSLILPREREESEDTYKCDAIKKGNARLDRHIIVVKNVKCREEKTQTATLTATTTLIKGTDVPMETSTSASISQTSKASTAPMDLVTSSANIKTSQGRGVATTARPIKGTDVPMETSTSASISQTSKANTAPMDLVTSSANIKTSQGRGAVTTTRPTKGTDVPMETNTPFNIKQTTVKPTTVDSMTSMASSTKSNSKPLTNPGIFATQSLIACGGLLNNTIGGFQSPNFPNAYPANSHCKWTISVPQAYAAINITFDRLHLEHDDNCGSDYIVIQDELRNKVGCRLCGIYKRAIEIQVRGKVAFILFKSDNSVQKTGFRLRYKSVKTVADPEL